MKYRIIENELYQIFLDRYQSNIHIIPRLTGTTNEMELESSRYKSSIFCFKLKLVTEYLTIIRVTQVPDVNIATE